MMKYLSLFLCLAGAFTSVFAQKWKVSPDYTYMSAYGDNMLKVKQFSRCGIIDYDGKEVVPVNADSITDLSEGYGLVLRVQDGAYRIEGILKKDKTYTPINEEYYVGDYAFFSEYKLPVMNNKGLYGYIDPTGRKVIDFKYTNIHPFSEGYAAVSKTSKAGTLLGKGLKMVSINRREKMCYIDDHGIALKLQSDLGNIYGATSFYKGEAMVTKKDKSSCIINTSGNIIRIDNNHNLSFNKKYCIINGDDDSDIDFDDESEKKLATNGFQIRKDNDGKFGLSVKVSSKSGQPVVPIEKEEENISIKLSSLRARANTKNTASVTIILTNSRQSDVNANIKVTGALNKTNSITIPANGRTRFTVTFTDVVKFEKRNLSVEAEVGGKVVKRTSTINLEPNFDDL